MKWRTLSSCIVAVLLVAACSGDGAGGGGRADASPTPGPPEDVFQQFPECPATRPGKKVGTVRGLLLPEGTEVYTVRRQGPITTVQGFVMMTPIEIREFYESKPNIQILVGEDEIVESELLFSNGKVRNFVKARAACRDGSDIVTVIARELTALPAPSGAPSPSASPAP